jgi:hypothetical protein
MLLLGLLAIVVAAPLLTAGSTQCDTGKAVSQVSNVVTVETGPYIYQWRENGSRIIIFTINDAVAFCQKGSSFFVVDADGRRHRFSMVRAIKRQPQPAAAPASAPLPPRGFAANLKQGPPSFHAVQVDKQWKAWMSTSGPEHYLVRVDGEHVYVEQVLDASAWLKIDTTLSGGLYTGTVEYGFENPLGGKPCTFKDSVEFRHVDPSRIEGAMKVLPESAVIDASCRFLGSGPRIERFTWIPE